MAVRALPTLPAPARLLALLDGPARAGRSLWARARGASKVARARAGYAAGVTMAAWGIGVLFGLGWALLAGGLVMSASFLLLYPVDEGG